MEENDLLNIHSTIVKLLGKVLITNAQLELRLLGSGHPFWISRLKVETLTIASLFCKFCLVAA